MERPSRNDHRISTGTRQQSPNKADNLIKTARAVFADQVWPLRHLATVWHIMKHLDSSRGRRMDMAPVIRAQGITDWRYG
jgi:hypothetical protein